MNIRAISGGIPIGGMHLLLEVEGKRIAIDCGAVQKNNRVTMPPVADGHVDLLLVTHGHLDHVGALAYYAKHHPETKIYGTKVTRRFAKMLLEDSLDITTKRILRREPVEIHFNWDSHYNLMKQFKVIRKPEWFSPWPNWKIRFWPNGHINGSAAVQIITPSGVKIMVSGDICFNDQPTVIGARITRRNFAPEVLIVEGTYGSRELPVRYKEENRFVGRVKEILACGGHALVPSFSISGVNIAALLARSGVPTYIDGMIRKAAKIINQSDPWSENDRPFFLPDNLYQVKADKNSTIERKREEILAGKPVAIVSTHGMLEGGPVLSYLFHILPNPKSAVLICGHQAEGTAGSRLLNLKRGQEFEINGSTLPVYCNVERFHLSGHASGKEVAEWVVDLGPWIAIVVHATKPGFEGLKKKINSYNQNIKVLGAFNGQDLTVWE